MITVMGAEPPGAGPPDRSGRAALDPLDAGALLTSQASEDLRAAVRAAAAEDDGADIRLLLDRVARFDTSGLGLLVGLHRLARQEGARLVCVSPAPALWAVLRRRGLHRVLHVEFDIRPDHRDTAARQHRHRR